MLLIKIWHQSYCRGNKLVCKAILITFSTTNSKVVEVNLRWHFNKVEEQVVGVKTKGKRRRSKRSEFWCEMRKVDCVTLKLKRWNCRLKSEKFSKFPPKIKFRLKRVSWNCKSRSLHKMGISLELKQYYLKSWRKSFCLHKSTIWFANLKETTNWRKSKRIVIWVRPINNKNSLCKVH